MQNKYIENSDRSNKHFPFGCVEPHAYILEQPHENAKLYKILSVENFLKSLKNSYLHFQRVDSYKDSINSGDADDGAQLPKDQPITDRARFLKEPSFSATNYYNISRSRTYACCFSLENSPYIWRNYGGPEANKKICLVFNFGKLRKILNDTLDYSLKNHSLLYGKDSLYQMFSINYGIVDYIYRGSHKLIQTYLPNPIEYIYLKDKKSYEEEKELRISLSAIGLGKFVLKNGEEVIFPSFLQYSFDFKLAFSNNVIQQIQISDESIVPELKKTLEPLKISMEILRQ